MLYNIVTEYISGKLREEHCTTLITRMEKYQTELSILQNEKVVSEQELRREILHQYINDKTESTLCIIRNNGSQFYLESVIEDEDTFFSILSGNTLHIRTRVYGIDIAIVEKATIESMKTEYEERCSIILKNQMVASLV